MRSVTSRRSASVGFTLIELLLVIAIIAALAIAVFIALNPAQRIKAAHDARRQSDVDTILSAIHTYVIDNKGNFPPSLIGDTAGADYELGSAAGVGCPALSQNNCVVNSGNCDNLGADLTKYLKSLPIDPKSGTASLSGYVVNVDANNIVTVKACFGENNTTIQTSR